MIDLRVLDRLRETLGGNPADLAEIIESFLGEAPELVAQMTQAAEKGDQTVLARAAHSLKSNARDLGAMRLAALCEAAEAAAKAGTLADAGATAAEIAAAWDSAAPALVDEFKRIARSA